MQEGEIKDGDRVMMGSKSGVVQAVNGEAVMVLFDGETLNEIVDCSRLTKETSEHQQSEGEKQDQEPERGPDQTLTPGLHRNEQQFGADIDRTKRGDLEDDE